jgi:hypothetical protein
MSILPSSYCNYLRKLNGALKEAGGAEHVDDDLGTLLLKTPLVYEEL